MLGKEIITRILASHNLIEDGEFPAIEALLKAQEEATQKEEQMAFGRLLEAKSYDKRYGYHHCKIHAHLVECLKRGELDSAKS